MYEKYRILRDNKERGPLTLEELLDLNLKPLDLIWVEGRSAGWRYPTEIDQLKSYLDENVPATSSFQAHPASRNARTVMASAPAQEYAVQQAAGEEIQEESLTAEKLEQKASEIYRRVQAYAQQKEQEEQGVQTKYAKSLEDLKQEYADWLHKKKKGKRFQLALPAKKPMMIAAVLLVVLASGWIILSSNIKNTVFHRPANLVSDAAITHPSFDVQEEAVSENNSSALSGSVPVVEKPSADPSSVDAFIDSVEKVLAHGHSGSVLPHKQRIPEQPKPLQDADTETKAQEPVAIVPASREILKEYHVPRVSMNARYEHEANRKNISNLEVTIQNNDSETIRSVSVEVFYYKKGDRLFDRETIYFSNILPGNSLTVSRPGNKKAVHAKFELGQVTLMDQ